MKRAENIIVAFALLIHFVLITALIAAGFLGYRFFNSIKSEVRIVDGDDTFPVIKQRSVNWESSRNETIDLSQIKGLKKQYIYRKSANSDKIANYLLLADSLQYDCNFSILSFNKETRKIKLIAIPGSLVVLTQGYEHQRLADVYRYLGIGGAVNALNYCYGLDIQRYAFVDFDKLCSNLNRLGTVRVSLTKDEVQLLNQRISNPLPERSGKHNLTFEQVVQLLELDIDNSKSNEIVDACIERIKSRTMLYTMYSIITNKNSRISTNIPLTAIYELSTAALEQVNEIEFIMLPIEKEYRINKLNGRLALFGYIEKNAIALDEFIYGTESHISG